MRYIYIYYAIKYYIGWKEAFDRKIWPIFDLDIQSIQ